MADRWKSLYSSSDSELKERVECVRKAMWFAIARAPSTIYQTTGHELSSIAKALIPGLLGFLGILVASTATGAFLGASVGVLFFGLGVAPGAYAGAAGGFNVGVSILNYLGLGFLAAYIGGSFYQASFMARLGLKEAWEAPEDKAWQQSTHVFSASQKLSEAITLVFAGILQGVVAFLLAKGTANAAKRVPELVGKLRESKLGTGFATWVEANWKSMIENPRLGGIKPGAQDGSAPFPKDLEPLLFPEKGRSRSNSKPPTNQFPSINRQREELATNWYKHHDLNPDEAASRAKGFNFSKPVEKTTLQPGTKLEQWVVTGRQPGIDFTTPGTDPKTLGIKIDPRTKLPLGREKMIFEVKEPIKVLKGTAADYPTGQVRLVGGPGGGPQIAMPPGWQEEK